MKFLKKLLTKYAIVGVVIFSMSCSDTGDNNTGLAKLNVKLTDAPGDFEAVNIDVQDVLLNKDENTGWESIGIDSIAGIYNLLELTGGVSLLLVDTELPEGKINQIRLLLGDNNSIVKNGDTLNLKTPSAQQSGLKLKLNDSLQAGYQYTFIMDFDVDKSIVAKGNGGYNLKPVIRISSEVSSGSISGSIIPTDVQTMASVEVDGNTISAFSDNKGTFVLHGVPEGIYTLTLTPDQASGLLVKTVENVEVVNGKTTDLNQILLE